MGIIERRNEKNKESLKKYILYVIMAEVFLIPLSPIGATIACIIGIFLTCWRHFLHRLLKFESLSLDTPMLIFVLISICSIFVSQDKFFSFYNFYNLVGVYLLTYFLVGQNVNSKEDIKYIIKAILTAFTVCVFYGFYQAIFGINSTDVKWVDPDAFPELKRRIFSTWENPNIFAGYITMILALLLGLFAHSKVYREKIIYVLLSIFGLIALTLTYARGALLSILVIYFVYGIMKDKRILLAFMFFALCLIVVNPMILERISSVFTMIDTSGELRLAIWEATIAMIEDHPLLGIGWGSYFMAYPEYDFYMQGEMIKIVHAHNIYLNYAAEIGIIGAIAFFWFFFGALKIAAEAKFGKAREIEREMKKLDEMILNDPPSEKKLAKIAEFIDILKVIKERKEELGEPIEATAENETEPPKTFGELLKIPIFSDTESMQKGLSTGCALLLTVVALNGLTDCLLFNIPTSMYLWFFIALIQKNANI